MLRFLLVLVPLVVPGSPPDRTAQKLAPPALEGWVQGPDGRAVEGASVSAWIDDADEPGPRTAVTDAVGRFRIVVAKAVPHILRVEAKGLAPRTLERMRPGAPQKVSLGRALVLEGVVRNGATGKPVPGARVEARTGGRAPRSTDWEPGPVAVTDANGHYRLGGLGPRAYDVSGRARGGLHSERHGVRPGPGVDLVLLPGPSLAGSIHAASGAPVAAASIRLELEGPNPSDVVIAASNAGGRFEVTGLAPGVYRLVTLHTDFAPNVLPHLRLPSRGAVRTDVTLGKGGRLAGRLLGPGARPAAGTIAIATLDGEPTPASLLPGLRAEAGDDGRFVIARVPPGAHVLSVVPHGCAQRTVEVEVPEADLDLGDIAVEVGLAVRGRVLGRGGASVPDASIVGTTPRRGLPGQAFATRSDPDGSFALAGLPRGSLEISVTAPGYAAIVRNVEAGTDDLDLVLDAGGAIAGVVVDGSGKPVESYTVAVQEAVATFRDLRDQPVEGSDGRFLVEDLAPGSYVLQVEAPGHSPATVSRVEVASGRTMDVGRVRLASGGVIRGSVMDATGAPVAGAILLAYPPRGYSFVSPPQGESDASGAFELEGVPVGPTQLVARHPDFAAQRVDNVRVDPARPAEVQVVLARGGRIEGTVRRRDGSGVGGLLIQIGAGARGVFYENPQLPTGGDGAFALDHVPGGHWQLAVMGASGGIYTSLVAKEVEVVDGGAQAVELVLREIAVSGTVTRAGSPAAGLRVGAQPSGVRMRKMFSQPAGGIAPAGPQLLDGITQDDGSYQLILGEGGPTQFDVTSLDGQSDLLRRTVEVPDADAFALDLSIQGSTVSGVVLDRLSRAPIPRVSVLAAISGKGWVRGETGADGRFELVLDPGDYTVSVHPDGYVGESRPLSVSGGSSPAMEFLLATGLSLSGRVVDATGQGVGEVELAARPDGVARTWAATSWTSTLPDGTFTLGGLLPAPYCVTAWDRARSNRFAALDGFSPGQGEALLVLHSGGSLKVEVRGPGGGPVGRAMVTLGDVCLSAQGWATDDQGWANLDLPQGTLEVRASKDALEGRKVVTIPEGGTVSVTITLRSASSTGP